MVVFPHVNKNKIRSSKGYKKSTSNLFNVGENVKFGVTKRFSLNDMSKCIIVQIVNGVIGNNSASSSSTITITFGYKKNGVDTVLETKTYARNSKSSITLSGYIKIFDIDATDIFITISSNDNDYILVNPLSCLVYYI